MNDADRDLLIVSMVAFDEASDQGQEGIRAQIHSVVNRHAAGRWYSRKTLAGTCLLSWQYSALNDGDPNRERGAETSLSDEIYQLCMAEAAMAIAGASEDPTAGATHYYRVGTKVPVWAAAPAVQTAQIKDHIFFKDVA